MNRRVVAVAAGLATLLAPATVAHGVWQSTASATLAVTTAPGVISPPADVRCTNGTDSVTISWNAPAQTLVDGYEVYVKNALHASVPPTATQTTIASATAPPGAGSAVMVRAVFAPGVSSDSAPATISNTGKVGVRCG